MEGTDDTAALCKWLTLYVAETRKQDGCKYPLKTLYSLLSAYFDIALLKTRTAPTFSITVITDLISDF